MTSADDFREAIPHYAINKALDKEHRYKGFLAQYIGYLFMAFGGCFVLGMALNLAKLPIWIAFPLPLILLFWLTAFIRNRQKRYGKYGWAKEKARRIAPHGIRKNTNISKSAHVTE